jgi:hypothetical protein
MSLLNSFGSILSHAIQLESSLHTYYQKAGQADRAREAEKRKSKLERVRRENVLEITLEPIDGLDEADYVVNFDDTSADGQRRAEEIASRFYTDIAPKINVLQARRALERCAQEHGALAKA